MSNPDEHETIVCSHCFGAMVISSQYPKKQPRFCVYCGVSLGNGDREGETQGSGISGSDWGASLISGQTPAEEPIQFTIGPYQILRKVGEGGMGEVFLAYDLSCGRRIAIKRIRSDLKEYRILYNRFLKEARITSQLSHPAIIPIYDIVREGDLIYYTMPYLEGQTLKQLLRDIRKREKERQNAQAGSVPSLVRIFISVCQAIAYAHSKGVLHRDIKPENIFVGRYGETKILDWGLADLMESQEEGVSVQRKEGALTRIGKVVGTLSYMAPERALGASATIQTEIYALGVVLYQILTLTLPFKRKSLASFKSKVGQEPLKDPIEVAPYRDIPKVLATIVTRCLNPNPKKRFQRVQELIYELESFIEGRSEWFLAATLSPQKRDDWEFQENVLIADFTAISRDTEETRWVNMMVSKHLTSGNTQLETDVTIEQGGEGFGLLLSIPEKEERQHLMDGYCLWLSADPGTPSRLIRSGLDVLEAPDLILQPGKRYHVALQKVDESIHLFLDRKRVLSYISHLPQEGPQAGLMFRDNLLDFKELKVYEAGQNVLVKCLAVPDAFLAHGEYGRALSEYRRIGASFPGRAEGREALFRAGVTLLEQGKNSHDFLEREESFQLAFEEFEKLKKTPGAPLEYLGKALIYQVLGEYEEEAKCYDIAFRRTPDHPLLPMLEEQLLFRAQESSRKDRLATYAFSLLLIRHCPDRTVQEGRRLLDLLHRNTETPWFLQDLPIRDVIALGMEIAYNLGKGHVIEEFLNDNSSETAKKRAAFLLRDLDRELILPDERDKTTLLWLAERYLFLEKPEEALTILQKLPDDMSEKKGSLEISALLLLDRYEEAGKIIHHYLIETLSEENSPLLFPYGCWLYHVEGKEIAKIHFQGLLESNFPLSTTLAAHLIAGKLDYPRWKPQAFFWEKRALAFQMLLFSKINHDEASYAHWKKELAQKVDHDPL
jgi:serine/threonine-protein kinase